MISDVSGVSNLAGGVIFDALSVMQTVRRCDLRCVRGVIFNGLGVRPTNRRCDFIIMCYVAEITLYTSKEGAMMYDTRKKCVIIKMSLKSHYIHFKGRCDAGLEGSHE